MEHLRLGLCLLTAALVSCAPDPGSFDPRFAKAVTALWISSYQEDSASHQFVRTSAWGEVPEKLVADGMGGYSVAVPLLLQSETSDGPLPDQFWTVLVRVVRTAQGFALAPNEALPGAYQTWYDEGARSVWFRGSTWQFKGRY